MNTKLIQLQNQLLASLANHRNDPSDAATANTAFSIADQGLEELKKYPTEIPFKSGAEHELYHHTFFPFFAGAYQYLGKVCWALEVKSCYGSDLYSDFLNEELEQVTKFLKYHLQYSQYTYREPLDLSVASTTLPNQPKKKKPSPVPAAQQLQLAFHSPALKAHIDYKSFLETEKKQLESTPVSVGGIVYEFVGSQADAMENIEGWTEMKVIKINGEFANLRQVAEMWTTWFRKPIPNIYSKKRINQNRKKEKAPFLTRMAEILREAAQRPKSKRV